MKKIYLSLCAALFAAGAFAQVDVTFQVDMTPYINAGGAVAVNASNIKVAGNFTTNGSAVVPDWDPASAPTFNNISGNVYSTTINFPASSVGSGLEFKFLITTASWGNCNDLVGNTQECLTVGDPCTNGSNDNRFLTIPAANSTICFDWNTCNACTGLGIKQNLDNLANLAVSPNPVSDNTIISFGMSSNENVQVVVYNSLGALVSVLSNESKAVGTHKIEWNTTSLEKGLYTVVVRTSSGSKSTRVAVQ
jgi:hypothetical protein